MATSGDNPVTHSLLSYMVVTCGTKVTKALARKRFGELKPKDRDLSEWTFDAFLEKNKDAILKDRIGRDTEWLYFPLDSRQNPIPTSFDKWDISQTIFILLLTCHLESETRMYLKQLRKLRNKLAHSSNQNFDESWFEYQKTKVTTILGHCLLKINDNQLTREIHDSLQRVENGTIFQNVEQHTEQADTRASLGKRGHFGDEPTERKLETTIELLARIEPVLVSNDQTITVPDVGIRIVVKNCSNDRAKVISKHMAEIFNDVIQKKYDDFEELSNEMRHKMREAVIDTFLIFLSNGRQIVHAEENCVVLQIRCVSLVVLLLLFRDYVNGVLDENMQFLEAAIRRCDGYESTSLEVTIFKDEFWNILTVIAEGLETHVTQYETKEHHNQKQNGKSHSAARLLAVPFSFPTKRKDGMDEYLTSEGHENEGGNVESQVEEFTKSPKPGMSKAIEKAEMPDLSKIWKKSDSDQTRRQLLISIDLGTSNTGFAWSFSDEPNEIHISNWKSKGATNMECQKTPSTVLFDKDENVHTFGFEAEELYQELKDKNSHLEWFFFRSFMHQIRCHKVSSEGSINMELTESGGKTLLAAKVLTAVFRYLKKMILKVVHGRDIDIEEEDICWILAVLGERCEDEKQFIEHSAIQAGLSKVHVVDESAATIAFLQSQFESNDAGSNTNQFPLGVSKVVIDIGGKLSNIYAYQITKASSLCVRYAFEEVGGDNVNVAFERMLENLFGAEVINQFQLKAGFENLDFFREFENKKRKLDADTPTIKLKYPALLRECLLEKSGITLQSCIARQGLTDEVALVTDKIMLGTNFVEAFFDELVNKIFTSVKNVINQSGSVDHRIILVGGFSEHLYIKEKLGKKLKNISSDINLVTVGSASLHIIKGAIILGRKL